MSSLSFPTSVLYHLVLMCECDVLPDGATPSDPVPEPSIVSQRQPAFCQPGGLLSLLSRVVTLDMSAEAVQLSLPPRQRSVNNLELDRTRALMTNALKVTIYWIIYGTNWPGGHDPKAWNSPNSSPHWPSSETRIFPGCISMSQNEEFGSWACIGKTSWG